MKIVGAGNKENRLFFSIEKDISFFPFFTKFLINCNLEAEPFSSEYLDEPPNINLFNDAIYNFKNENYDLDLIFGSKKIFLIIRAEKNLLNKIKLYIDNLKILNKE